MDKVAYKEMIAEYMRREAKLENELKKAKQKIDKLETDLYFCHRNNRIVDEVQKGK